jgi:hypothetical protein
MTVTMKGDIHHSKSNTAQYGHTYGYEYSGIPCPTKSRVATEAERMIQLSCVCGQAGENHGVHLIMPNSARKNNPTLEGQYNVPIGIFRRRSLKQKISRPTILSTKDVWSVSLFLTHIQASTYTPALHAASSLRPSPGLGDARDPCPAPGCAAIKRWKENAYY